MDEQERSIYQESLKNYWDLKSSMDTYYQEGFEEEVKEGEEKGKKQKAIAMAQVMIEAGEPIEKIVQYTGLSRLEVEALR